MRWTVIKLRNSAGWSYGALCACRQMNWRYLGFGLVLSATCCGGRQAAFRMGSGVVRTLRSGGL
jgi:hypothetical protein